MGFLTLMEKVGRIIEESIGDLEEVKIVNGMREENHFLILRAGVDVRNPPRKGMKFLASSSGKAWLNFQYEKLPNFCYSCGRIRHIVKDCVHWQKKHGEEKKEEYQFGEWMRIESFHWVASLKLWETLRG
ncbi:zf-CCHC_4 domain-containing protein [Cephalotus follicularis]|uniref:Zf-CCHC_4 domain-containing protein n=1 Tax=Cephalotus follicularis TaxID=3775 RepID=A0A1Q3BYY3_CEPFO|nr:zf-CCHC_4 domain-containing protein [Cephalotus follicularis]